MSKKKPHSSLYMPEEIERLAQEGWNTFWGAYKDSMNEDFKKSPGFEEKMEKIRSHEEFLYFSAFEAAINAFIEVFFEDSIHEIELCMDELGKLSASVDIKEV